MDLQNTAYHGVALTAMQSAETFKLSRDEFPAASTRSQKLQRELGRLMSQVRTLSMRPLAVSTRRRFVFILGHMRSGSSLLCHLLCNSDEIIGFGEAHHSYRRRSDLARLLSSVRRQTGENPLRYRYVLDKIVGTQHEVGARVLSDPRTRFIFLVREPRPTIASIVAMRRQLLTESHEQLVAFATNHYRQRLGQLSKLAHDVDDPKRCMLMTHRQLLEETASTFVALEQFLELASPLREVYRLMPTTGQVGIGDPSPNIRLGKIERSLPRKEIALPAEHWTIMEECYENCFSQLRAAFTATSLRHVSERKKTA